MIDTERPFNEQALPEKSSLHSLCNMLIIADYAELMIERGMWNLLHPTKRLCQKSCDASVAD